MQREYYFQIYDFNKNAKTTNSINGGSGSKKGNSKEEANLYLPTFRIPPHKVKKLVSQIRF